MKWVLIVLGGLVGLVVLAVIVLALMGTRKGAGHAALSVEINRPPEAVWPWLTEADKQKQWVSWLTEVRDLTPETRGVGKKMAWVMDDPNMKKQVEIMGEIVAEEPGRMISVRLSADMGFDGVSTWRLTDLGGRTRFDSEGTYHYHHWLARLMEPLVTPQARKKMVADTNTLIRLVESEPMTEAAAVSR